eukprot:CAMPEP_0116838470 /NCGR_PEP_ID=MMETSP0418-20121206/9232_1 /TAXON_ID=1158023 /ORGANISM="Astrosyne radiata, Strain 13vi08-1A" /LENGTH=206 /DNA_ID=CAMNT_0004468479 /DNA_START=29 /DNA_END=649 /DNA_ORIENTATION=+
MPVSIDQRNQEHFDLLGLKRFDSAEYDTTTAVKKQPAASKSVSFNETVNVHFIIHSNDLNDEEFFNTWYQKRDFQMMRVEFAETVAMITEGTFEGDSNEHSSRGLEYRTRVGAQRRKLNKLHALCAVLKEQDRQMDMGVLDEDELQRVYMEQSAHCKEAARYLAIEDEEEAMTIFEPLIAAAGESPKSKSRKSRSKKSSRRKGSRN